MIKIDIQHVSKVFGSDPGQALTMLDQGAAKDEIYEKTGQAVGLANVSFQVQDGEILVVMGLSGSGKSTLIRCINRLIEPSAGTILVDGMDITRLDQQGLLEFRRNKLGMVFQNFALLPHRNIIENVEYGLEIQHVAESERREKAREALQLVGLEGWEEARPSQLSGGMQQRVGLARALAVDPEILLMDEAFSALDPLIRREMQDELLALHRRMGKTILFVSHDLDEAIKLGDRIVLMKDGEVVQVGTAEDIMSQPANAYVERFVEDVNVAKVYTAETIQIEPKSVADIDEQPQQVLKRMQKDHLSSLVVVGKDEQFRGVLHLRDLQQSLQSGDRHITDIMVDDVPRVKPDTPLTELFGLMASWHGPLPVVDDDGALQGIVLKRGILDALDRETGEPDQETA